MYVTSSAAVVNVMLAGGSCVTDGPRRPQRDVVFLEPPRHVLDVGAIEPRGDLTDASVRLVVLDAFAGTRRLAMCSA